MFSQARKVLTSLKSLIKDAQRRGLVAQNVAQPVSVEMDNRDKPRPKIGIDIPTKEEVRGIADHCS